MKQSLPLTIGRSVFLELLTSFLLALVALNFVLMMEKVIRVMRLLSAVNASALDLLRIILFLQPMILILTIPMAFLIATIVTYGRMQMDSEVVALRAAGASFRAISSPAFLLAVACFGAALFISFSLGPAGTRHLRETITEVITSRAAYALEEGAFTTDFKDLVVHVKEKPSPEELREIFIYDGREGESPRVITAGRGRSEPAPQRKGDGFAFALSLYNGLIHMAEDGDSTVVRFKSYSFRVPLDVEGQPKKLAEYDPAGLLEASRNAPDPREARIFLMELHKRLSLSLACLVLALIGPPLALKSGRSGRFGGLVFGLIVLALYYAAMTWGENLAIAGSVPVAAGAWMPVVLLSAVGLLLFKGAEKL